MGFGKSKLMSNKNLRFFRIISAILTLACLVWGYWWMTWALAIIFLFLFPLYYEIIAWGVIYDAVYGLPLPQFYNFPYTFTLASFILFILAFVLKKYLTAYEK